MATGTLTLGIPGNTATNFATTPIPSLVLSRSEGGAPLATRSEVGWAELVGRSIYGTPQIAGPTYAQRYQWAVAALVTEPEARQLAALAKWQDAAYKSRTDGALRLIDETEYLADEPNPHSRTLLSALITPWNSGYRYGYGVFSCKLQLPENWRTSMGRYSSGTAARLVTFTLSEL